MDTLRNSFTKVMDRVFSSQRRRQHADEDDHHDDEMDPSIRSAVVASEVSTELDSSRPEVLEIDSAIEQAKEDLAKAEEKERFVGLRIYKYQNELHEQRQRLDDQIPPPLEVADELGELLDEENPDNGIQEREEDLLAADYARLVEKWERDSQALEKVVESHRTILMHCETIRRKLKALETKRQELESMRRECGEFAGVNDVERHGNAAGQVSAATTE